MAQKQSNPTTGESSSKLVSREAMLALGFTENWPSGNPTEPWWDNPFEMPGVWFTQLPTVEVFWKEIEQCFRDKEKSEIRSALTLFINLLGN